MNNPICGGWVVEDRSAGELTGDDDRGRLGPPVQHQETKLK